MSLSIVEDLVVAKKQLEAANQQLFALLAAAILDTGQTELRLTKTAVTKTDNKRVTVRGLKTGGVVITVTELDK